MVQRKNPSKLGVQADHVKSDKPLANLKLSSSQNQVIKSKDTDRKKKMKKPRSIKLSDLETLQSPPSGRILSQQGKPLPFHVPTTAPSPQKQKPLARTIDRSPNYMKPTSSSDAKKELFPASLWKTQSGLDGKKASSVCSEKPATSLTRSSSLVLIRTLTKTPSFKPSRVCPRKSATTVMSADVNAPERATCSSTLKDSKFPSYLILNPGATECEGASVMKVCSYKYCSLNCHHQASFPPLKTFMPERRHLLMTQKSMKMEALSPQRLKVSCETKVNDIEQIVFDGKPAYDEAELANPTIHPLAKENLEDQEVNSIIEENGLAVEEDGVKEVTPSMAHDVPNSEFDLEEDSKNCFDDVTIESDTKRSFHQEQNAEEPDENHQLGWYHEEVYMGSYSSEVSYDGEHMENIELDVSDSQYNDMLWEEEQYCALGHEEDIDSSVFTEETNESVLESLHDVAKWMDDIGSSHNADILVEEAVQEANEEESTCSETEPHGTNSATESANLETNDADYYSNRITCDQSSLREEVFQNLTNAEDDNGESEKHVCDDISSATNEEMVEACEIDESREDSDSSLENSDESISQEKQSIIVVKELQLLEGDQVKANKLESISLIGHEKENTNGITCDQSPNLTNAEDDNGENEKHVYDDISSATNEEIVEACEIDESREDSDSSLENTDESIISQEKQSIIVFKELQLLEEDQVKANKLESISLIGHEKENTNRITCDQSSFREDVFQNLINAEDDNGENEKHVYDDISSATNEEMVEACEIDESHEDSDSRQENNDESISPEKQSIIVVKELQLLEEDQVKANKLESISLIGHEKENTNGITYDQSLNLTDAEDDNGENKKRVYDDISTATNEEMVEACEIDESREDSDSSLENSDESISQEKQSIIVVKELQLLEGDQVKANKLESISLIGHEKENTSKNWQRETRPKKLVQDDDEGMRKINPRKPNFLPLAPDPEPEKVNLKHQMMDERKNADEWMLDFALRQAVTKLAPAGKRKVALLVEAFETVMSIPKCETHVGNNSPFAHARPIQACS